MDIEISSLDVLASVAGTEKVIVAKEVNGVMTAYAVELSLLGAGSGVSFATAAEIATGTNDTKALNPLQFKTWLTTYFTSGVIGNSKIVETTSGGLLTGATKGTAYNKSFGVYTDIDTGTSEVLVVNPKAVKDWWTTSILGAALGNSQVVETNGSGKLISAAKATAFNKAFGVASDINTGTSEVLVLNPKSVKDWWTNNILGAALGNSQVVETNGSGKLISVAKGTAYNKTFGVASDINTGTSEVLVLNPKSVKDWWTTYIRSGTFNISSVVMTDGSGLLTTATANNAHNKTFATNGNVDDSANETAVINPKNLYYFLSGVNITNEGTGEIALFKSKTVRDIKFRTIKMNDTRLNVNLVGDDYELELVTSSKFASFTTNINTTYFNTTPTASYTSAGYQYDAFSKRFSLRGSIVAIDAVPAGTTLFTLGASHRPNTDLFATINKFDTTMTTHTVIPVKIAATTGVVTNLLAITNADKVFLDTFTFVLDNDLV